MQAQAKQELWERLRQVLGERRAQWTLTGADASLERAVLALAGTSSGTGRRTGTTATATRGPSLVAWVRGVCEKPRVKCAECPNRRFLPVTDDVIRWHLSGLDADGQPFVAGIYPLLLDETGFFLAVDFDKAQWQDDAAAFLDTCR